MITRHAACSQDAELLGRVSKLMQREAAKSSHGMQVSAMLILGGAAVMTALTGMNLYAVSISDATTFAQSDA